MAKRLCGKSVIQLSVTRVGGAVTKQQLRGGSYSFEEDGDQTLTGSGSYKGRALTVSELAGTLQAFLGACGVEAETNEGIA